MSTPNDATATWFPKLDGLKLPRALVNAIQQAFSLIYSLRDSLSQLRAQISASVGVTSLSPGNLTGAVALAAGANITLSQAGQTITITGAGGGGGGSQTPWQSDIDAANHSLLNAAIIDAADFSMTGPSGVFGSVSYGVMIDQAGNATFRSIEVGPVAPGVPAINSGNQFVGPGGVNTTGVVNAGGFETGGQPGLTGIFRLTGDDGVTIYRVTFTNGIMTQIQ